MKSLACLCFLLLLTSANAEDAALSADARRQLFSALHTPTEAESAFTKLASNIPKQTGPFHFFVPTVEFKSAHPVFVNPSSGREVAVVKIHIRQFVCGCGFYNGGVESSIIPAEPHFNHVLIFDDLGTATHHLSTHGQWLCVIDATGSGKKEELVRWSNDTDLGDSPFLVIHDLTKPDLPGMLNITFNPHLTEPKLVTWPTDENGDLKDTYERDTPHPTRFSRWRFEPAKNSKFNDVVIDEKKDGKYTEVARFAFDPVKRLWSGPEGGPEDVWQVISNEYYRAKLLKPGPKDFVRYRKFDPDAKPEPAKDKAGHVKIEDE